MKADPLAFLNEPYRTRYREPATALWERLATVEPPPENPVGTQSGLTPEQYHEAFRREVVVRAIRWCEELRRPDWDPFAEQRRNDAELVDKENKSDKHETIVNTARRLATLLQGRQQQYELILGGAINAAGMRFHRADKEPSYVTDDFVSVLWEFVKWGENIGAPVKRGPFMHRSTVGPLSFEVAIDGRAKLPGQKTCLAVCLANEFRRATSGDFRHWPIWHNGARVLQDVGDPMYPHVANFIACTFDLSDGYSAENVKQTVRKFLRNNPTVGIGIWR